jgi:hypothetical protein
MAFALHSIDAASPWALLATTIKEAIKLLANLTSTSKILGVSLSNIVAIAVSN